MASSLFFTCPTTHQKAPAGIETDVQAGVPHRVPPLLVGQLEEAGILPLEARCAGLFSFPGSSQAWPGAAHMRLSP